MSTPIIILLIIGFVFTVVGICSYNSLRRKYAGIIGVGGSYLVATGIFMLIGTISDILRKITGGETRSNTMETVLAIIFAAIGILYLLYVMFTKCTTVKQRIFLPFVALMIAFGFCFRLVLSIFFHIPMEAGEQQNVKFAEVLIDPNGDAFRRESDSGDHADYYCSKTGQRVQFWETDLYGGAPQGWRVGS